MEKMHMLRDLFLDQLRDIYSAENQLVKGLPGLVKAAGSPQLRQAIEDHFAETETHIERLDEIFRLMEESPKGKTSAAMKALIKDAQEFAGAMAEPSVRDAGLIATLRKVEHYEIAAYDTLCTWADQLGRPEYCDIIEDILAEEKAADRRLSDLAEGPVNDDKAGSSA